MYNPSRSAMLTDLSLDPSALRGLGTTLNRNPTLVLAVIPLIYLGIGYLIFLGIFKFAKKALKLLGLNRDSERPCGR